jgi:iron complex outermembrane receptor protein
MSVLDRKPGAVAWAGLVGLSITASITPALGAEGSAGDAGATGPSLEEVVVTAQKREERLQEVPVAISAVGTEAHEANRVTDLYTLASSVPWVNMTQDSDQPIPRSNWQPGRGTNQ